MKSKFKHKTSWIVITGAPYSGKTTALRIIEKKGYQRLPEVARVHIKLKLSEGLDLATIRKSESDFQFTILNKKLEIENTLNHQDTIFLDRGIPDSIAYYRFSGIDPNLVLKECYAHQYKKVFMFDRLPLETDHARIESDQDAQTLQNYLESDYRKVGYKVIHVPVMSVNERVEFILSKTI